MINGKIGFAIGEYAGEPMLDRRGESKEWEAFFELTGLDGNYDLEDLLKNRLPDEDTDVMIFDSESSWFVVVIKDRFRAQEICNRANNVLRGVLAESIMDWDWDKIQD